MISKAIEGSLEKTSLKKIRIHQREYELADAEDMISNYGPTMIYLLFKSTNPDKRIGVSNLKYEIEKSTLAKFDNNVKYILDGMSANYTIIIDKGERNKDYVVTIFRDILSDPKSNFNSFIETTKDNWDTG